ncbi:MAG TPA: PepSY-associated TM helix domain-containing protein [Burkholderiales bacterium]|nr:PepSY-associated TM helix domain-containing protein [Burkholderiales bacterium]
MRKIWFQIHWAIGITAGIVLAVVGVTGACLSFQNEILRALNPALITVAQRAEPPLPSAELLSRIQAARPEKQVTSLTVYRARDHAARVVFAAKPDVAGGPGSRRSEVQYADPYTGELLGESRGARFFRLVMETHRWLAAGAVGKHVVGASTIALVVMCLSGLYLRWPRRVFDWRAWLTFDRTRRGRRFLRDLHATVGTWVLIPYFAMGLTGLYWSYDWYRDALYALTGAPRSVSRAGASQVTSTREGRERSGPPREEAPQRASKKEKFDLAAVWFAFERAAGPYTSATLRVPNGPGQHVQITYLRADSAHDRAFDRVVLDARSGAVLKHERYADKAPGAKLMSSVFALHSGRFFGLAGSIVLMAASALMPLFAITGWMLYLGRHKKRAAPAAEAADARADATLPL